MVHLILDFDSTFIRTEALEELLAATAPGRDASPGVASGAMERARELTEAGMAGTMPFARSLALRAGMLQATREEVAEVAEWLRTQVTPSFLKGRDAFRVQSEEGRIHVVSGGFRELILPVVADFHIPPERVFANTFRFDSEDRVVGVDPANPLSRDGGKVEVVRSLALEGVVVAVGDGMTDLELRKAGAVDRFIAFTENRRRTEVVAGADAEARSLEEVWSWCRRWS